MDFKLIGSILLIIGTCIGAGMLGLPIAAAEVGYLGAVIQLLFCWFIMTVGAFLILEVNLRHELNSNLITMAGATIGPIGQIIAWITYLLLLYTLLCAYIAGGSGLFHAILVTHGFPLSPTLATILFTLLLSIVVFLGIRSVDYMNRGLMTIKFSAFFLLIILLTPFISSENLLAGNLSHITVVTALMVTITSFGYSPIIPSLRIYFAGNVRKLKLAIIIGSIVPLLCYIAWDAAIMGVLPLYGDHGLTTILNSSQNQTANLVSTLTTTVHAQDVTFATKVFTAVCMVTSFLGVGLCLNDFLADGLSMEKVGRQNLILNGITFLPPLIVVIFFPNVFVKALEYAGIICVILLILMPAWMAWCERYVPRKANPQPKVFTVFGGKPILLLLIVFAIVLLIWSVVG